MDFSLFLPNMAKIWSQYWKLFLFTGLKNTLILTFISVALGTVLGTLVAMLKMSKSKILRFIASVYVEVLRGTPILLQLYVFYFVLPNIFKFMKLSQFMWVSISLCINSSAYVSEVIRSGIQAVDKGQTEAARSLGLSEGQTMVKIILPQAVRNILPALGNEFIMMLKETSLASTFFLGDFKAGYDWIAGDDGDDIDWSDIYDSIRNDEVKYADAHVVVLYDDANENDAIYALIWDGECKLQP